MSNNTINALKSDLIQFQLKLGDTNESVLAKQKIKMIFPRHRNTLFLHSKLRLIYKIFQHN